MHTENIKAQMRKGFLEYCILLIISKEASYAPDIIRNLKKGHLIVMEGTLYPLLTRLKNNGLLDYSWAESNQGPPRKYYELTERGRLFLYDLEEAWQEIRHGIDVIKEELSSESNLYN
ncbi:MAG: PadR family transcriptional regulator [Prevotellaceae bacterium]|nr:PadR family transcriptional regulator [Prevotellaceae bacterium]